jgi:hypothetical protein
MMILFTRNIESVYSDSDGTVFICFKQTPPFAPEHIVISHDECLLLLKTIRTMINFPEIIELLSSKVDL